MTLEYRNARLPRPPVVSFRRRMPRVSRSLPYRVGAGCEPWGNNNLEVALAAIRNLLATWTSTGSRKPATPSLLKGHTDAVRCLAFAPDGALLASGSSDGTVRLWEVASGREATQLRGHVGWVVALAFTPDGLALASGGNDQTVRLWDVAAGRETTAYLRRSPASIVSLAYSPDGQTVATGDYDGAIVLRQTMGGGEHVRLTGHARSVTTLAFAPGGELLASGSHDGTVKLWHAVSGAEQASLRGHVGWVFTVAFTSDGRACLGR